MSLQSHLQELERRHADIDRQIEKAMSHPSTDNLEIAKLKRTKLHLKDEMNRLRATATIH